MDVAIALCSKVSTSINSEIIRVLASTRGLDSRECERGERMARDENWPSLRGQSPEFMIMGMMPRIFEDGY